MPKGKGSEITAICCAHRPPHRIRSWAEDSAPRQVLSCDAWRQLLVLTLTAIALCVSDPSYAQAFGKINTALQTLVDFMTGTTGRLLGILGVAGLGIAAWFGRLSYWRAGEIVLGIAIVFGASEIVDLFAR